MAVSLVALFVALGGTAYATTGAGLVLGTGNDADAPTSLIAQTPLGGAALGITNLTTRNPAAAFTVQGKTAPFTVSSTGKVRKLNADMLDGLDATQLQRRLTGSCDAGSAITGIDVTGAPTCEAVPHSVSASNTSYPGAFPVNPYLNSFHTSGGLLQISFDASAFSAASLRYLELDLIVCSTSPCGLGNAVAYAGSATGFANEASSHKALVSSFETLSLTAGTYYLNVVPGNANTVTDNNDVAQWSIIEF